MAAFLLFLLLHPNHETVMEAEYQRDTKRMEIALRLDVLSEQQLRRDVKRNPGAVEVPPKSITDRDWIPVYVSRHVAFSSSPTPNTEKLQERMRSKSHLKRYRWVGRQEEGAHVWWYFEIESPDGEPKSMLNTLMLDMQPDCQNRVLLIGAKPKRTLIFNQRNTLRSLVAEPTETPRG